MVFSPDGGRAFVVRDAFSVEDMNASPPKMDREYLKELTPFLATTIATLQYLSLLLCRWVNVEIDTAQLEDYLDDNLQKHIKLQFSRSLRRDGREILGGLRLSHARGIAKACRIYYRETYKKRRDSTHLVLVGSPQLGKTRIFCAMFFLLPVIMYVATNRKMKIFPILSTPPKTESTAQIKMEMEAARQILGKLIIKSTSNGVEKSVESYFYEVLNLQACATSEYYQASLWNQMIMMRTRNRVEPFQRQIKTYVDNGFYPVLFNDECHHGSKKDSVLDRKIRELNGRLGQVAISATPAELTSDKTKYDWQPIQLWIDESYVGPRHWNGCKLPVMPGYKEKLPDCHEITKGLLSNGFDREEIDILLSPKAFGDIEEYASNFYFTGNVDRAWIQFRHDFAAAVYKIFDRLCDQPECRRAACFRLFRTNNDTIELVKLLHDIDSDLKVIQFYGKHTERRPIREICYEVFREHKRTLILVTGHARMSDSFPRECGVFLDLTERGSTHTSVVQGTFGRACGHNKKSLVLLRDVLYDELNEFLNNKSRIRNVVTGRITRKKLHERTATQGPGRSFKHYDIKRKDCNNDFLRRIFTELDRVLSIKDNGKIIKKSRMLKKGIDPRTNVRFLVDAEIRDTILSNKVLAELPKYLLDSYQHIRFLLWGQEDKFEKGYYLALSDQNMPEGKGGIVGRRWVPDNEKIDWNNPQDIRKLGWNDRRTLRADHKRIEIQIFSKIENDTVKVQVVTLRLLEEYAPILKGKDTEVDPISMHHPGERIS